MSLSMRSAGFARRDTTVRRDRSFPETARRAPTRMKPAGNLAGSVQRGEWGRGIPRGVRRMVSHRACCSSARSSHVLLVKRAGLVTLRTYPKFEGAISSSLLSNFHSKAVVSEERPRPSLFLLYACDYPPYNLRSCMLLQNRIVVNFESSRLYHCVRAMASRYFCPTETETPFDCPRGSFCPPGTLRGDQFKCPVGTFGNRTNLADTTECSACTAGPSCQ